MRPRQIFRIVVAILVLFVLLSWCAGTRDAAFLVFLGRDIGETGFVSDTDWADFEKSVIVPALGNYTVLQGQGAYLPETDNGLERSAGDQEQTVILLYVTDDADEAQEAIDAVAEAYKERFDQQSVLIIKTGADILSGADGNDDEGSWLIRIIALIVLLGLIVALVMGRTSDLWR